MRNSIQLWIQKFLGLDRLSERLETVEKHFVTKRDPTNGVALETLADRQAALDGRPAPKPIVRGRSWDQIRRYREATDAVEAMEQVKR